MYNNSNTLQSCFRDIYLEKLDNGNGNSQLVEKVSLMTEKNTNTMLHFSLLFMDHLKKTAPANQ